MSLQNNKFIFNNSLFIMEKQNTYIEQNNLQKVYYEDEITKEYTALKYNPELSGEKIEQIMDTVDAEIKLIDLNNPKERVLLIEKVLLNLEPLFK